MRDELKSGPTVRRGATLVLVAILIVVTGGMAAFAIDLARVYSGVNELQTGADASALSGAHRLMTRPQTDPTPTMIAFAGNNSAFGSAVTLTGSDIEGGFWNPVDGSFTPADWATANAVRVTTNRSTGLSFGRLLGLASLSPTRRAIGWVGNQSARDCIKPFGIDLAYMNTLLSSPITTQAGIAELRTLSQTTAGQQRLTIVAGPSVNNPQGTPNIAPTIFSALTGTSSSRKEYLNALRDASCGDGVADYTVSTTEESRQPGQGGGDIARATIDGLEPVTTGNPSNRSPGTCAPQIGNDATCYAPGSNVPGVEITLAMVTPTAVNAVNLNMLVTFRLMCVFRGGNTPGSGRQAESCPWLSAMGATANNYVQGTIVGYPMTSQAVTGNGNSLGNTLGTAQRIVLVR